MFTFADVSFQVSVNKELNAIADSGVFVPPAAYEHLKSARITDYVGKSTHEVAHELIQKAHT